MTVAHIFNLFLLISALHGFLFCSIILFSENRKEKSLLFINLLVLTISLNNIQSWLFAKGFFSQSPLLEYLKIPWHFLIAPFFYLSLVYYLEIENSRKNHLKKVIDLFISMISIKLILFYFLTKNNINVERIFEKYVAIEETFSLLSSLAIFTYSYIILSKKEQLFAKILSFDNLKWIYTFFKLGLITYIFWIVALVVTLALDFNELIYSYYPLRVLTTILIYWIGYQSIIHLRLLKERKNLRKQLNFNNIPKITNLLEEEKDEEKIELFNTIHQLIEEKKLYTEPKLSADYLANEFDLSTYKMSNVIKLVSGKNFNDYINEFRIALAKKLLMDKNYKNYTITSIGLESGFNSKSTFYYTFKKHTGVTPTEYQTSLLK